MIWNDFSNLNLNEIMLSKEIALYDCLSANYKNGQNGGGMEKGKKMCEICVVLIAFRFLLI